jgi:hydrogenase maturation protease
MIPGLSDLITHSRNLLFVGVGNLLKSDDGVGAVISRQIIERPGISALTVEVSIENYIGKIQSLSPEEMVLIDCAQLWAPPGTYRLLELGLMEDFTFNTHNISLGRLGDFFNWPTYVLGIQPENLSLGQVLSPPVLQAATEIIGLINHLPSANPGQG